MTELIGTIYKCQHCEFTGTHENFVKVHEEKCLENQKKNNRKKEIDEIYSILDIDVINIKISAFLVKYNIKISYNTNYCSIDVDNNCRPSFSINGKLTSGLFDRNKFQIQKKLANEYHEIRRVLDDSTAGIDSQIENIQNELNVLIEHKKSLVPELTKTFLRGE